MVYLEHSEASGSVSKTKQDETSRWSKKQKYPFADFEFPFAFSAFSRLVLKLQLFLYLKNPKLTF